MNPYNKDVGPPLTSPEPMVASRPSHVAIKVAANDKVESVLKFFRGACPDFVSMLVTAELGAYHNTGMSFSHGLDLVKSCMVDIGSLLTHVRLTSVLTINHDDIGSDV